MPEMISRGLSENQGELYCALVDVSFDEDEHRVTLTFSCGRVSVWVGGAQVAAYFSEHLGSLFICRECMKREAQAASVPEQVRRRVKRRGSVPASQLLLFAEMDGEGGRA